MEKQTTRARAKAELARHEKHGNGGSLLRQVILGGQDGLVNVLGVILGVAAATNDARIVIIAGLAATFAESISMAAVAYTSARAAQDYYAKELENEEREIKEVPEVEREEIRLIYMKKGFRGKQLEGIVRKITSDKKIWLQVMMGEELGLTESKDVQPVKEGVVVGVSALVGSLVPLLPYFLMPIGPASMGAIAISVVILFAAGIYKARITVGNQLKSGAEMAGVGIAAALAGYAIGALLGVTI